MWVNILFLNFAAGLLAKKHVAVYDGFVAVDDVVELAVYDVDDVQNFDADEQPSAAGAVAVATLENQEILRYLPTMQFDVEAVVVAEVAVVVDVRLTHVDDVIDSMFDVTADVGTDSKMY